MQEIQHPATLLVTSGTHIALKICHLLCALMCTKISTQILLLGLSLLVHVSMKHSLYVHVGLLTLICLIIDYNVNKDTVLRLVRCVQPSKYL